MKEEHDIFEAYDIRGTSPKELDPGIAYLVGRAIIAHTQAPIMLVGRDMRLTSPELARAVIRGARDQGADVVDMGRCSTPEFYYATRQYPAGVMVTASHLPKEFNGLKLCREHAIPIGKNSGMGTIKRMVLNQKFPRTTRTGELTKHNYLTEYVKFSLHFLKTNKPFKVVVDAGNGMGGITYKALKRMGPKNIKIIPQYFELDGRFPNHIANPIILKTMKALQKRVVKEKADLGLALDGDGDRCRFVDEKGTIIPVELTSALIAHELLHLHPGAKILFDVRSSKVLHEEIRESGGVPVIAKAGHAFIKRKMRRINALFGIETPGHLYHREIDFVESTMIPLFRILNLIGRTGTPLSELIKPLNRYAKIPETNFTIGSHEQGLKIIARVEQHYKRRVKKTIKLDGLRMEFDNWWFSLRLSNTEPLLRLNLEADDAKLMREKLKEIKGVMKV